jgi:1,4-alpha-glucan branching enzyme
MSSRKPYLVTIDPWLEPHIDEIVKINKYTDNLEKRLLRGSGANNLSDFALGHLYFGLHRVDDQGTQKWVFREWAPNATRIYLTGEFSDWQDDERFLLKKSGDESGVWEIYIDYKVLKHLDNYKLHVYWKNNREDNSESNGDKSGYRIPSYASYVVQDPENNNFNATVWCSEYEWSDSDFVDNIKNLGKDEPVLIYEVHVGMSSEAEKVSSFSEFTKNVLPRIVKAGYNTVQLMAIQEHPYYGSFGYHVSNFFAVSSRFGTPDDFKDLVNAAHKLGLKVIIDLVHSHAVKNEAEGLSNFAGDLSQYFHKGSRGENIAWDSRCFDYGKPKITHFLLSNCRFWLDEYHLDGFRLDGVTSMIYRDHGLGKNFTNYSDYYNDSLDLDAVSYLSLANKLIHQLNPQNITIAEEMSALPGLCLANEDGGIGFDYRLAMSGPDVWVKTLRDKRDEDWQVGEIFHQLSSHRPEEKTVNYAESHDQAIVGDKTIIQWLIDKDLYDKMSMGSKSLVVDRGVALHKMIRLITFATNSGGYLNFMGNEFGHPEWIDFPREGNNWSYKFARRQWNLADDKNLRYCQLGKFDKTMLSILFKEGKRKNKLGEYNYINVHDDDHVLSFMRDDLLFVFNFHPVKSYTGYAIPADLGEYDIFLDTDDVKYGGFGRVDDDLVYNSNGNGGKVRLYLPARVGLVLRKKR